MFSPSTMFPLLALGRFNRSLRSVLFVVVGAWVWLLSGSAVAGAAEIPGGDADDVPAPMCDPNGASIAAQPDMDLPLLDRGRLDALSCEALLLLQSSTVRSETRADHATLGDPDRPVPLSRDAERSRHDGVRALDVNFPARSEPAFTGEGLARGLSPSRGHHSGVYRPPV